MALYCIITSIVFLGLSVGCYTGIQYALFPNIITATGSDVANHLYYLFAFLSLVASCAAYIKLKREKAEPRQKGVGFINFLRNNEEAYDKLLEELQPEEYLQASVLVPDEVKEKLEQESNEPKQENQPLKPTVDMTKFGEKLAPPEPSNIPIHTANKATRTTVPQSAPIAPPPISVPVFTKTKQNMDKGAFSDVTAPKVNKPTLEPPKGITTVSSKEKQKDNASVEKQSPFDIAVQAFNKQGIPSSAYAINERKPNSVCVVMGKHGEWLIFNDVNGTVKNLYISYDEHEASRLFVTRVAKEYQKKDIEKKAKT